MWDDDEMVSTYFTHPLFHYDPVSTRFNHLNDRVRAPTHSGLVAALHSAYTALLMICRVGAVSRQASCVTWCDVEQRRPGAVSAWRACEECGWAREATALSARWRAWTCGIEDVWVRVGSCVCGMWAETGDGPPHPPMPLTHTFLPHPA